MAKFLRFFMVFLLLSAAFGVSHEGQFNQATTLFGPETFIRNTGQPKIEKWQFSTGCFNGPFLFHLRNGDADGKNRVSSANVWLDGRLLFGPSDFSQKISGYDIVVELKAQSILEVKLASSPGSKLKIWIEGTPIDLFQYESITLSPTGGHYRLSNGIEMDIPEGAVSSPIAVTLRRIMKQEVDPIMQSYGLTQKYFLAGYQGEPHGFVFNLPIRLRLPSEPFLNGRDVPFRFSIDREHGAYCFASEARFTGSADIPMAKIEENESEAAKSTKNPDVRLAQSPSCVFTCDITRSLYDEEGWVIEACTSGLSEDETDYAIITITDPASSCQTVPLPCTCVDVFTTEEAMTDEAHTVGGYDCIVTGIKGYTTFCGCPGYPTFAWEVKEEHKPVITWSPKAVKIEVGEQEDLEWDVVDAEGQSIRGAKVTATIENKDVAGEVLFTEHTGAIAGKSCGSTRIKLTTLCNTTEYIDVTVEAPDADIVIDTATMKNTVETCGTLELSAKVYTKDAVQIKDQSLEWSTSDATLATVSPAIGVETTLTSQENTGDVDVVAKACNQENHISIHIEPKANSIVISPQNGKVEVGKTLALSAIVSDKCKNQINNAASTWDSLNESIATVDSAGFVTGVSVGTATISATCDSLSAETQVEVFASVMSVTIEPAAATIGIGETIHLIVKIDGSIIPGATIAWRTIPSSGYFSFDPITQNVTGVAEGTATLVATYNGISAECKITVNAPVLERTRRYELIWSVSPPLGLWEYDYSSSISVLRWKLARDTAWIGGSVIFDFTNYPPGGPLAWSVQLVGQSWSMQWHETFEREWSQESHDEWEWQNDSIDTTLESYDTSGYQIKSISVNSVSEDGWPISILNSQFRENVINGVGCPGNSKSVEGPAGCWKIKTEWDGNLYGSGTFIESQPEIAFYFLRETYPNPMEGRSIARFPIAYYLPYIIPFDGTEVVKETQTYVPLLFLNSNPEFWDWNAWIYRLGTVTGRAKIIRVY